MLRFINYTRRNNIYSQSKNRKGGFIGTRGRTRTTIQIVPVHLFLLLFIASFVVSGDDTNAVRDTISCLCSLNSGTQFGKCCEQYPIESIAFSKRESWSCYANEMRTNEKDDLILLFVLSLSEYLLNIFDFLSTQGSFIERNH